MPKDVLRSAFFAFFLVLLGMMVASGCDEAPSTCAAGSYFDVEKGSCVEGCPPGYRQVGTHCIEDSGWGGDKDKEIQAEWEVDQADGDDWEDEPEEEIVVDGDGAEHPVQPLGTFGGRNHNLAFTRPEIIKTSDDEYPTVYAMYPTLPLGNRVSGLALGKGAFLFSGNNNAVASLKTGTVSSFMAPRHVVAFGGFDAEHLAWIDEKGRFCHRLDYSWKCTTLQLPGTPKSLHYPMEDRIAIGAGKKVCFFYTDSDMECTADAPIQTLTDACSTANDWTFLAGDDKVYQLVNKKWNEVQIESKPIKANRLICSASGKVAAVYKNGDYITKGTMIERDKIAQNLDFAEESKQLVALAWTRDDTLLRAHSSSEEFSSQSRICTGTCAQNLYQVSGGIEDMWATSTKDMAILTRMEQTRKILYRTENMVGGALNEREVAGVSDLGSPSNFVALPKEGAFLATFKTGDNTTFLFRNSGTVTKREENLGGVQKGYFWPYDSELVYTSVWPSDGGRILHLLLRLGKTTDIGEVGVPKDTNGFSQYYFKFSSQQEVFTDMNSAWLRTEEESWKTSSGLDRLLEETDFKPVYVFHDPASGFLAFSDAKRHWYTNISDYKWKYFAPAIGQESNRDGLKMHPDWGLVAFDGESSFSRWWLKERVDKENLWSMVDSHFESFQTSDVCLNYDVLAVAGKGTLDGVETEGVAVFNGTEDGWIFVAVPGSWPSKCVASTTERILLLSAAQLLEVRLDENWWSKLP